MKNQVKKTNIEKITDKKLKNEKLLKISDKLVSNNKISMTKKTLSYIKDCGTWLQFLSDKNLEKYKLYQGVFCKNRFCPICSKNKSKRDAIEIKVMTNYTSQELKRQYIFLTLTAPNVNGKDLGKEIDRYNKAFNHLVKLKKYKSVFKGYIRKLEVTYNNNKKSKSYGTYHPHFHILVSVNPSYFKKKSYINRDELLEDWRKVMNDDSITQVDIRRVKIDSDDIDKGILELTKYVAKDSNYLVNEYVFEHFYKGLKGKRQFAYNGDFKLAREKLKNGELEEYYLKDETEWYYLITYKWLNKEYKEVREELKIY